MVRGSRQVWYSKAGNITSRIVGSLDGSLASILGGSNSGSPQVDTHSGVCGKLGAVCEISTVC